MSRGKKSTTGFNGVYLHRPSGQYKANIRIGVRTVHLGTFKTPEEAARAYDQRARIYAPEKVNFK